MSDFPTTETEFDTNLNRLDSLLQGLGITANVDASSIESGVFGSNSATTGVEFGVNPSTKQSYIQSRNFVSGTTGWQILSNGTAQFMSITLTGGTVKYGKASFTDSTSAGYYIGAEGVYFGSASDASKLKYNINTGAFDFLGTIAGGSTIDGKAATGFSTVVNDGVAPAAPTGLTTSAGIQAVFLKWTYNAETDLDHYDIYRHTSDIQGSASKIATVKVNMLWDSNLTAAQAYYYWIKAVDRIGNISGFNATAGTTATPRNVGETDVNDDAITALKINVANLAAINADLGSITAGTITMPVTGWVKGGQTAYNTGTGFFLGYSTDAYKFSIGNPAGNYFTWDGSNATFAGTLSGASGTFGTITSGTITGVTITGSIVQTIETFTTGDVITAGDSVCIKNGYSTISATADTYVNEDAPTTNYDNSETLMVGNANKLLRFFAKFDVGSIVDAEHIQKAELHIKVIEHWGDPNNLTIKRCTSDWSENGAVTWNAQPTVSDLIEPGNGKTITGIQAYTDYYADITELVRNWKTGALPNYGIRVTGATAGAIYTTIGAMENPTSANRITLRITDNNVSDGKIYQADSDDYNLCRNIIGISTESKIGNQSCKVQTGGKNTNVNCVNGDKYYISTVAGGITNSVANQKRLFRVGFGATTNELLIDKSDANLFIEKSTTCRIITASTEQYVVFSPDSTYAIVEYSTNTGTATASTGRIRVDYTNLINITVTNDAGKSFSLVTAYEGNGMELTINSSNAATDATNYLEYTVYFYK